MAWTRYVEQCCLDLAEAKEAPLDEYLIYYIRIQKIAEEAGIMFGYSDWTDEARLSPERIQLSVRAFVANLQEIEKSFPPEVASMRKLVICTLSLHRVLLRLLKRVFICHIIVLLILLNCYFCMPQKPFQSLFPISFLTSPPLRTLHFHSHFHPPYPQLTFPLQPQ